MWSLHQQACLFFDFFHLSDGLDVVCRSVLWPSVHHAALVTYLLMLCQPWTANRRVLFL